MLYANFKEYKDEMLTEAKIEKGIPSILNSVASETMKEVIHDTKIDLKIDLTKCSFKEVKPSIVARVERNAHLLDGSLYYIVCLDTGGKKSPVGLARFSRNGVDKFEWGQDVDQGGFRFDDIQNEADIAYEIILDK